VTFGMHHCQLMGRILRHSCWHMRVASVRLHSCSATGGLLEALHGADTVRRTAALTPFFAVAYRVSVKLFTVGTGGADHVCVTPFWLLFSAPRRSLLQTRSLPGASRGSGASSERGCHQGRAASRPLSAACTPPLLLPAPLRCKRPLAPRQHLRAYDPASFCTRCKKASTRACISQWHCQVQHWHTWL